ncbi:MAG: hypothetical protein M1819_005732 [Sarea resinae]|nr:MAG: hypothetical protein M1819_005732 [Sarea resinae]
MPPRIPSFGPLRAGPVVKKGGAFYCPSCALWRLSRAPRLAIKSAARSPARSRQASTLASSTAVNAHRDIPLGTQELHHELAFLKTKAANYVNLSRLQLALRGLEARDPTVRVAVLGLDGQEAARKVVRVLLADPLAGEGQWETQLESSDVGDSPGLVIRYGEVASLQTRSSLLPILTIPSHILRSQNLEILVSSLDTDVTTDSSSYQSSRPVDAILVPALQARASSTGRFSTITYPVHRALLFGDGVEGCVAYGRYAAGKIGSDVPKSMVNVALGLPSAGTIKKPKSEDLITVDVPLASSALSQFRASIENATVYERGWFQSGMPILSQWLTEGSSRAAATNDGKLKPAIRNLIDSLLDDAEASVTADDSQRLRELVDSSVPEATRESLQTSLRLWAERGHTELRDQLDIAFAGKRWRRLAWWKLLWRVDDVGMITSELLGRRWLVEAEKEIIWLAGRIEEAGFFKNAADTAERRSLTGSESQHQQPSENYSFGSTPPPPELADLVTAAPADIDDSALTPSTTPLRPWPLQIPVSRAHLIATSVPPLQALAQKLVLQTLSTTSLSLALSALLFVSVPQFSSVYSAGAVAALGTTWALRRLQSRWEGAKAFFEGEVREEGRQVLRRSEGVVGGVLESGGKGRVDEGGVVARREARDAIERARRGLARLQ